MKKAELADILEKNIKNDINEALKPMDLRVKKIEFTLNGRMWLTINLETVKTRIYA